MLCALRIPGKDSVFVLAAMQQLEDEYGDQFSKVFKTIIVDNGAEFSGFAQVEKWGNKVYFAHPYTSWECPQNERSRKKLDYLTPEELYEEFLDSVYAFPAS